jgi:hypothetical protein
MKTAFSRKRIQNPAGLSAGFFAAVVFSLTGFLVLTCAADETSPGESPSGESSPRLPAAGDFAGTIELSGNPGSLLSFEIPEDVYRGLERPDMGDIRIYDSRGNPAPFFVRGAKGVITFPPEKNVPVLVWNEQAGRFTSPGVEINVSGTAITINPSAETRPRTDTSGGPAGGRTGGPAGNPADGLYLADLSGLSGDPPPSKIVLDFEGDDFFNARLSIRKSDDLARWEDYGRTQTAAFYNNPGTDRNEFDIPRARYLLLEFNGTTPPVASAAVRFDPVEIPAALRETSFAGTKSAGGKTVRYHTEGRFPVRKLLFSLAEPDSIRFTIKSRSGEEDAWSAAGESVVYRIEAPGEAPFVNGPVEAGGRGPWWEIEALDEQLFAEVPRMALLWEAREIVFLARGDGPWTLAYGGADYGPPESSLSGVRDGMEIFPAALGRARYAKPETGGRAGPERWKQAALWGVLILAAAILSGLAVYIIKSTKNGG